MEKYTFNELHRETLEVKEEIRRMHTELFNEIREVVNFCNDLDRRLTRTEERVLFFCATAGALSGLASSIISKIF